MRIKRRRCFSIVVKCLRWGRRVIGLVGFIHEKKVTFQLIVHRMATTISGISCTYILSLGPAFSRNKSISGGNERTVVENGTEVIWRRLLSHKCGWENGHWSVRTDLCRSKRLMGHFWTRNMWKFSITLDGLQWIYSQAHYSSTNPMVCGLFKTWELFANYFKMHPKLTGY